MTSLITNGIRRNRRWLNVLMFPFSVLLWLDVASNRDSILHAIGKLGLAIPGYGTVNFILLVIALAWSFVGCFVATTTFKVDIELRPLLYFLFGISSIVAITSLVGIVFDNWFATHFFFGLAWEFLELFAATWISWIILFKPSRRNLFSGLLGSGLFGVLALIAVTSIALLICPRVTFRF
jgi:hypothetical protein